MKDLFLKFETETQADEYLFNITPAVTETKETIIKNEVLNKDGSVKTPAIINTEVIEITPETRTPKFANVDKIGTIYKPTGEVVDDVPVMEALDGYHVNVRVVDSEDSSGLEKFVVAPKNPVRVWG